MSASSRFASRLARLAPTSSGGRNPLEPEPEEALHEPRRPDDRGSPEERASDPPMFAAPLFTPRTPRLAPDGRRATSLESTAAPSSFAMPAGAPTSGASTLDDLRARMEAILARTRAEPARPPPRVDVADLPFCVEHTPAGPLHSRTVRHGGEHRIGRIPVASGRRADADLLALLALDPRLASCDPTRALYLDTETTGLGPGAGTVAFLVGLAWFDPGSDGVPPAFVVEQLLVRRLGEEVPVLARVAERLAAASMLVTFNGKSFDMPVLRTRFVMNRMPIPVEAPHFDLVHVARRLHKLRGVGASLGAVEREVLGFVREDDVPSGEVSACYLHFLRTADPRALMGVVEHNAWDVVSMAALVGLYGEPLEGTQLEAGDLVGLARTLKRAGSSDLAFEAADVAIARGAGNDGTRVRAEIAKARGDKARALTDFEALAASVDDPSVRLELAKLYEHHAKDVSRALALVEAGTGEADEPRLRREARLRRKLETPKKPAARSRRKRPAASAPLLAGPGMPDADR
ncbi:MAG TPA: ribonuclease H-like domain-containing protein [Labilithrix sp.]|nr:ribonuclease H-like domain-containing protein [Labilithrix sp.]